ncbi:MAG: NAD+ synthase [Gemmatimonadetes bacterium]|nr:NAD+ synthase [Gemmatimonadota bacterium]
MTGGHPAPAERDARPLGTPGLNPPLAEEALTRFILAQVEAAGAAGVVVGLSGGIDSAVVATLCVRALGPARVLGLMMPSPRSDQRDATDAGELARGLGMTTEVVPLSVLLEGFASLAARPGRVREGNFTARARMALLYDRAARDARLVAGTSNKTELLLGYTTLWGDMAAAFALIGDLYKSQVRRLAEHLDVPAAIREKAPSAGLWPGQTDEEELGATYEDLDALLHHYADLRYDAPALLAAGFDEEFVRATLTRVHAQEFKRRMPVVPKLSTRTVGHDFLYPRQWAGPWGGHP